MEIKNLKYMKMKNYENTKVRIKSGLLGGKCTWKCSRKTENNGFATTAVSLMIVIIQRPKHHKLHKRCKCN